MEDIMKEVIKMIKSKELVCFCGRMAGNIMGIGRMGNKMVLEFIFQLMGKRDTGNG